MNNYNNKTAYFIFVILSNMYAFIDESGDHNMDTKTWDNKYTIFVLALVLIEKNSYEVIDGGLKKIKKDIFGSENFILHTKELNNPNVKTSDPRNKVICNAEKRAEFYGKLNKFIEDAPLKTSYMVIKKREFADQYTNPSDPYEISFENLLNRILFYSKSDSIEVYPECRKSDLDKSFLAEYAKYSIRGIQFHSPEEIKRRIKKVELKDRKENISGLQIADLLANPVGRHFCGIKPKPVGNEVPYTLARSKLAGNKDTSLTVFPETRKAPF
ncbi:MAG: DUF3800 domain-containing protein [Candidatus Paceibacterota bacterium]